MTASHAQIENHTNFFTTDKDPVSGDHTLVVSVGGATLTIDGATALAIIGAVSDAAWPLTGDGTLIAVNKANALAVGKISDAAWNGTDANASVISLLKALFLKP